MTKANQVGLKRIFSPRHWTVVWRLRVGLFAVPLLLITLAGFQFWMTNRVADSYREVTDRIGLVSIRLEMARSGLEEMEGSVRGYIVSDGDEIYRKEYHQAAQSFQQAYQQVWSLTEKTPDLRRRIETVYKSQLQWRREMAEPALVTVAAGRSTPAWETTWTQQNALQFGRLRAIFPCLKLSYPVTPKMRCCLFCMGTNCAFCWSRIMLTMPF